MKKLLLILSIVALASAISAVCLVIIPLAITAGDIVGVYFTGGYNYIVDAFKSYTASNVVVAAFMVLFVLLLILQVILVVFQKEYKKLSFTLVYIVSYLFGALSVAAILNKGSDIFTNEDALVNSLGFAFGVIAVLASICLLSASLLKVKECCCSEENEECTCKKEAAVEETKVEEVKESKKEEPVVVTKVQTVEPAKPQTIREDKKVEAKKEEEKMPETKTKPAEVGTEEEKDQAKVYHVVKRAKDKKWTIKFANGEKVIKLFDTKPEAVAYATELAKKQGGSVAFHASKGENKGKIRSLK
jgi:hypothetical protein